MNKVYVVNKAGHDFSQAEAYGTLVYLSEGVVNKFGINHMYRTFAEVLKDSKSTDYILMTGLTSMNVVACSQFTFLHGRLNLLIHKDDRYVERKIIMDSVLSKARIKNQHSHAGQEKIDSKNKNARNTDKEVRI